MAGASFLTTRSFGHVTYGCVCVCVDVAVEAGAGEAAAPRAMTVERTVERTISDGGLRLREAYQQISNLELSLVQVSHSVLRS